MLGHGTALSLRSYGHGVRTHAHEFHQIVLPVLGTLDMRVGDRAGAVGRRCGVLVVGGTAHSFHAQGENRFVVLDVPRAGLFTDDILDRASSTPFFAIDEALEHFVRYLTCATSSGALDDDAAYHVSSLLADSIGRRFVPVHGRPRPIARALAIIHSRYAEPLTVADLARAAGMGVSSFHERFRRETGSTPADCLAHTRLDRASVLLRDTGLPIAEIALSVGFSDQSALTRSFRRRRGTTPAALRRAALASASNALSI